MGRTTKQCWFVLDFTSLRICCVSDNWLPRKSDDSKDRDETFKVCAWGDGTQELPRELHVPYWKSKNGPNKHVVVTSLLEKAEEKIIEYDVELC